MPAFFAACDPSTGPLDTQPGTAQGNRSQPRRELGDSLAIRLPADLVEALGLQEGDTVELRIAGLRTVEIACAIAAKPLSRVSRSRAGSYGLAIIDALMLSSALQAASDTLWSEDMQHGMLIDGMLRIANPFCATS